MQTQTQQQTASTDATQAAGQSGQFSNENRAPYIAGYPQVSPVNTRDGNGPAFPPYFGSINLQNQRPGTKFGGPLKGNVPMTMAPFDLTGARTLYNGQFVYLPNEPVANGAMFNGIPPVSSFAAAGIPGHDQLGQLPYLPAGMYPSLNPSCSIVPGAIPGYNLPLVMNPEMQDPTGQKKNTWCPNRESKSSAPSSSDATQPEYSAVPSIDGSSLSGYQCNVSQQLGQTCLPLQVMKTAAGYVFQDFEVLTQQEPPIPRAVPAMWTNPSEMTLAKCLENREGITNVYIRGFLPETTDEMLHSYASRFGKIDRCKAIVDLDSSFCKGFGFVQYFNFESCENCIRGFFYLGYQASFAQKSRNSRLKDLEDKMSTNIYCTNLPIDWTEADLRRHFEPYRVVSEKISRDEKTGVSKEVGFARFETRDIAVTVLNEFHNVTGEDGVKLLLRFADTKAQKMLKHQSNERRAYRAGEYNYSVEVFQGSTPSPSLHRLQQTASHLTPNSQLSYASPVGVGSTWTPATSISPSCALARNPGNNKRYGSWSTHNSPGTLENTPVYRGRLSSVNRSSTLNDNISAGSGNTALRSTPCAQSKSQSKSQSCSPRKESLKSGSMSPMASRKEIVVNSPRSII